VEIKKIEARKLFLLNYLSVWYTQFTKTALRKHNLRVDFRVYAGDELEAPNELDLQAKLKSLLSSAIVKGLDIVGIVSKFGIEVGNLAKQIAESNQIDIKVIPGQDYMSSDGFKAVFYGIKQNIKPGLPIQDAASQCKKQGGKFMLYDLSRSAAKAINGWKSSPHEPDFVEIYNARSKAYKDLNIDYPRVISSAAKTSNELEEVPVFTELSRKRLQDFGFIKEDEGSDYIPGYLSKPSQQGAING